MAVQYEVKVAIDRPVFELYSYLTDEQLRPGQRVHVGFGRQKLVAVVQVCEEYDPHKERAYKLRKISKVIDEEPVYSEDLLKLSNFLSTYYIHPIGEVLKAMLPGGSKLKREITWTLNQTLSENDLFFTDAIKKIFKRKTSLKNASFKKNVKALESELSMTSEEIIEKLKVSKVISSSSSSDVATRNVDFTDATEGPISLGESEKKLTPKQSEAFQVICETLGQGFVKPILLHGVTGAGKTEIYLQLIKKLLDLDVTHQVLVMVPEISLTPQMTSVFEKRFPGKVAVVHSNLMDTDRWKELEKLDLAAALF